MIRAPYTTIVQGQNGASGVGLVEGYDRDQTPDAQLANISVDINGALVESNNNWKETEECLIQGTGLPPQDDLESALLVTLPTGAYTAIFAGQGGVAGVGLVEFYRLP